jgi:hypothetical protein
MKKNTGILFLVALVLGAGVYFYEWRRQPAKDETQEGVKPAFMIKQEDINEITVTRPSGIMVFDLKSDGWYISKPITARADQTVLGDLTNTLTIEPQDRTLKATPDDLATYGLVKPAITVEFKLQNGTTHKMQIGAKDFSGTEVYAQVDGSKDVVLLSNIIIGSADKPVQEFIDRMVLAFDPSNIASFDLTNASGEIAAQKDDSGWKILKPLATPGSNGDINDMLGMLAMAQITRFVSNNAADIAKDGLTSPAIRFRDTLSGGQTQELRIGKKEGSEYDALDPTRPVLFHVDDSLHTMLSQTFADLRAKTLFTGQGDNITRIEVRNQSGAMACSKDASGSLLIEKGTAQKGTDPQCPDFLDTLARATSQKIYDQPPAAMTAQLAKPAIEITLTDQAGKKTDIHISAASGAVVYGRRSDGASIYEFDRRAFDDLNFAPK